ncbi:MAG TPA: endonuclease/exonuclease/phosphatase family protein, partial [Actinomycetota bacterium]|nr:endonuclease/exonuclease/phosphatase family protein [Actinomycetota bacterium]
MRAMSLNLFGRHGDWPARRELLAAGLRRLRPDVVALQEAVVDDTGDQAAELLGAGYHLAHQTLGLVGDGRHHGASVASRWPILQVHEVDLHLTPRTGD